MPCKHRFHQFLIPQQKKLKFLFIGTFNPEWEAANGNNSDYFYGRATSLFWCILPHAFNENCLIDKGEKEWKDFCQVQQIGITDIISCVPDADEQKHKELLTKGFNDDKLDSKINNEFLFSLEFTTPAIINLINENLETIKGVFFTRSTQGKITRIWNEWQKISNHCKHLGIHNVALPTPSIRGGAIRTKIFTWRKNIDRVKQ